MWAQKMIMIGVVSVEKKFVHQSTLILVWAVVSLWGIVVYVKTPSFVTENTPSELGRRCYSIRNSLSRILSFTMPSSLCVTTGHSADESRAVFCCFDKISEHDMKK
jgi:hypothetical protein